jgi:hypothetical protein
VPNSGFSTDQYRQPVAERRDAAERLCELWRYRGGGAIFNQGTLSIDLSRLLFNEASQSGGAVHSDGTFTLTRSTVSGNVIATDEAGGGGIVNRGTMTISQSTVSGNQSNGAGGGIDTGHDTAQGSASLANSTLSGNTSAGDGAGLFVRETPATLRNVTVAYNQAATD